MRLRDAKKLHNRDEVLVRTTAGWVQGYVLGEPQLVDGRIQGPVLTQVDGFRRDVDYLDVR
jgi:hypothetical protein